jgi:hypothetical protein
MAKRAAGLTVRRIESERRPGMYGDGHGLYLHVSGLGAETGFSDTRSAPHGMT